MYDTMNTNFRDTFYSSCYTEAEPLKAVEVWRSIHQSKRSAVVVKLNENLCFSCFFFLSFQSRWGALPSNESCSFSRDQVEIELKYKVSIVRRPRLRSLESSLSRLLSRHNRCPVHTMIHQSLNVIHKINVLPFSFIFSRPTSTSLDLNKQSSLTKFSPSNSSHESSR